MSRVRIKFCGMTRKEDILSAVALGVDAIGLIFAPESRRCISISHARTLLSDMPPFVDAVAVLVNPKPEMVQRVLDEIPVQLLQFHGEETPEFCEQFNFPYVKAVSVHSAQAIVDAMNAFSSASALLLDTPAAGVHGGTGRTFDWQMIPDSLPKPYILAGGLNETNIESALKHTHPYAIDVCSGIESSYGIKAHDKMKRVIKLMRLYDGQ